MREVPESATELLLRHEGFSARRYKDGMADGVQLWSIGHGHQVRPGEPYDENYVMTREEARGLFRKDLSKYGEELSLAVKGIDLSDNEFGALLSLYYNIGGRQFSNSTVLKELRAGNRYSAAEAFSLWNKTTVNGELTTLPGLTRRRAEERFMFEGGLWGRAQDWALEQWGGNW